MNLQNLSIKRKLILITMLTSCAVLVLSSASFLIYDLLSFRQLLSEDLKTQAEIIGYNSAPALAFRDPATATATLSALVAKEDIVDAVLYGPDGKMFAHYSRGGGAPQVLPAAQQDGSRFEGGYLDVFHTVTLNGKKDDERLGTLFLRSDMRQWSDRAKRYATILFIVMLVSGVFALLICSKLQLLISQPILRLEDTMRMVSARKNYEVRAIRFYNDEIGRLIDGFNTMLAEIQNRDTALQRANDELKDRTAELEDEIINRRRTEEELVKAKDAAEDASRAKSVFLANMSHELRTPLNAIIGYSEMLEEEVEDSGKVENVQDLRKIQKAGKHLLSLINDVLDLSKIEAGKMGLHLEWFEVSEVIAELANTLQPALAKNTNALEVRVAPGAGRMRADVTKVRQILMNLLSNACKFTQAGTIWLEVSRTASEGCEWMRFRVRDTGIGMTAKQQEHLFQEFAQADGSISRKYGGTGLGLAISHRFAQLMKGSISVESHPGYGSTFTVDLPVRVTVDAADAQQGQEPGDTVEAAPEIKQGPDTVLVIDDDSIVRDLLSRSLVKMGFQVVAAANGEEGLQLARQLRPSVITLDVVMPDWDGWTVLNKLKTDADLADIPVIMVTIMDNEAKAIDLGASSYLIKPVDRDRLAGLIGKHRTGRPPAVVAAGPAMSSGNKDAKESIGPASRRR